MLASPVDFAAVTTPGLESSPHADALAGLRANEARYFSTKHRHVFMTTPADEAPEIVQYVARVLRERDIVIESPALEATQFEVDGVRCFVVKGEH